MKHAEENLSNFPLQASNFTEASRIFFFVDQRHRPWFNFAIALYRKRKVTARKNIENKFLLDPLFQRMEKPYTEKQGLLSNARQIQWRIVQKSKEQNWTV